MDWFKQHGDTIVILIMFSLCFWHLNEKITLIDKELAIVKTVMIMRNMMPNELAGKDSKL